jgi:hypothetical protein
LPEYPDPTGPDSARASPTRIDEKQQPFERIATGRCTWRVREKRDTRSDRCTRQSPIFRNKATGVSRSESNDNPLGVTLPQARGMRRERSVRQAETPGKWRICNQCLRWMPTAPHRRADHFNKYNSPRLRVKSSLLERNDYVSRGGAEDAEKTWEIDPFRISKHMEGTTYRLVSMN